jgi:hypothetical protein
VVDLPLLAREPTGLDDLKALGSLFLERLARAEAARPARALPRRGKSA